MIALESPVFLQRSVPRRVPASVVFATSCSVSRWIVRGELAVAHYVRVAGEIADPICEILDLDDGSGARTDIVAVQGPIEGAKVPVANLDIDGFIRLTAVWPNQFRTRRIRILATIVCYKNVRVPGAIAQPSLKIQCRDVNSKATTK